VIATCVIHDNPVPKERVRVTDHGTFTPAKTAAWEERVGWAYKGKAHFEGPVLVRLRFYRETHRTVDLDNLVKAVLDGLNGVAYDDDSQVVRIEAELLYDHANPRVELEIWSVNLIDGENK